MYLVFSTLGCLFLSVPSPRARDRVVPVCLAAMHPRPSFSWGTSRDARVGGRDSSSAASAVPSPSQQARENSLDAREREVERLRRQVEELRNERERLWMELRERKETLSSCISSSDVLGFTLSEMARTMDQSGHICYTAVCRDHFRILISEKDNDVKSIRISVQSSSPLIEIQKVLNALTEELCPRRIFMTVQQFIQMEEFRNNVVNQLVRRNKRCFRSYLPEDSKGSIRGSVCSIRAYIGSKSVLDLQWTFAYDFAQQSLIHQFESKSVFTVVPEPMTRFVVALKKDYTFARHDELWDKWDELCNWVASQ